MAVPRELRGPIRDVSGSDPREQGNEMRGTASMLRDGCGGNLWGHDFLGTTTVSNFRLDTRRGFRHFASVGSAWHSRHRNRTRHGMQPATSIHFQPDRLANAGCMHIGVRLEKSEEISQTISHSRFDSGILRWLLLPNIRGNATLENRGQLVR